MATGKAQQPPPTRIYFVNNTTDMAVAYDYNGMRQADDDISLGSGSWIGGTATPTRIYFVNNSTDMAVAYDYAGGRQSDDDISLGSGSWLGGTGSYYFTPLRMCLQHLKLPPERFLRSPIGLATCSLGLT